MQVISADGKAKGKVMFEQLAEVYRFLDNTARFPSFCANYSERAFSGLRKLAGQLRNAQWG
ncbi:MAG: hypothetical protein Kow00107_10090 [Planctomycetota bacterium]